MQKGKIQVIYGKGLSEILNRKSALGSYIYCLCEIFQKHGITVFYNGISFHELKNMPVTGHTSSSTVTFKKYVPNGIKEFVKHLLLFRKNKEICRQIEIGEKCEYILEFYTYASNIGYELSVRQKIPLIIVYDNPVVEEYSFFYGKRIFFKKRILKYQLKTLTQASAIVAYSNAVKGYLNKLVSKQLPIFIHQNVDFSRFDFLDKQFVQKKIRIGFIGSFLKWHRVDLLIAAFNRLKEQKYDVELFLIGHGVEYALIKEEVERSPYKDAITMTGFKDGEELVEMKKTLHIGVMPGSNWYGAPNKIFEYAAAKMAVVAPNTPTIADIFRDEQELLLFKQDDVNQLIEKLQMLCDDLILTERLAVALQQKIKQKYSEKNTFEFYSSLFS